MLRRAGSEAAGSGSGPGRSEAQAFSTASARSRARVRSTGASEVASAARVDALVLDLDTRAGLCIARSLGRAGCTVSVAARDGRASGLKTRYAVHRSVLPDPEVDFEAHATALVAALAAQPADAAIPSIDSSVEALHRHRDEIGRLTAPALGEPRGGRDRPEQGADASRWPRARASGAALAASSRPRPSSTRPSRRSALPCVLKPDHSWRAIGSGGERVSPIYVADREAGARRGLRVSSAPDAPVLVQELASGARETIKLFRDRGRRSRRGSRCSSTARGRRSAARRSCAARSAPPADTLEHRRAARRRDRARRLLGGRVPPRRARPAAADGDQPAALAVGRARDAGRSRLCPDAARMGPRRHDPDPGRAASSGYASAGWRATCACSSVRSRLTSPRSRAPGTSAPIASDYLTPSRPSRGLRPARPPPVLGAVGFASRGLAGAGPRAPGTRRPCG